MSPGPVLDAYRGRVNGNHTDDSSSGLASFTLHNLTKDHERIYRCKLSPDDSNQAPIIELVQLLLVGMYLKWKDSCQDEVLKLFLWLKVKTRTSKSMRILKSL